MRKKASPTVQLVHFGCAKNQVESEEILGLLAQAGWHVCGPGEPAQVTIINTCGFLQSARQECFRTIRAAAAQRKRNPGARLIVAGCLAQRYGAEIADVPGVDAVIGVGEPRRVVEIATDVVRNGKPTVRLHVRAEPRHEWLSNLPRMLSTTPGTAYLKIAEGCDHPCTFCTIPSIRGPYVSKPVEMVVREAEELVQLGVVELNLVAQDTTAYGHDLPDRPSLVDLITHLHDVPGVRWIRVLYAYPCREAERLVAAMPQLPRLCRYLDIPFQHADAGVLKAMKRPGDGEAYLRMLERMRATVPDLAIRTTVIVGFPGEDEEAFQNLLRFQERARFDWLGTFEYSAEPGTPAAEMAWQVDGHTRRERLNEVMCRQQRISLEKNRALVGRVLEVLIEKQTRLGAVGRSYREGPEADGSVVVRNIRVEPGSLISVRITDADAYDLYGEVVPSGAHNGARPALEVKS